MTTRAIASSSLTSNALNLPDFCLKKQRLVAAADMRSDAFKFGNALLMSKHDDKSVVSRFSAASIKRLRTVIGSAAASWRNFGFTTFQSLKKSQKPFKAIGISINNIDGGRDLQKSNVRTVSMVEHNHFSERRIESEFPRPAAIPWQKNMVNSVNLIGLVGKDPVIKYFDTGKICARSSLAVRKDSNFDETPSWFILEFWDELAEIAAHHLKKGNKIHVIGRLIVDMVKGHDQILQTYVKVVVANMNYIDIPKKNVPNTVGSEEQKTNAEKLWQAFFSSPAEWWDNRENKPNPNCPDFKHKSSGEALWIKSWKTPSWVKSQLEALDLKGTFGRGVSTSDYVTNRSSFNDRDFEGFQ